MISSPAVLDSCPRCGGLILVAHTDGIPARADAAPLDPHQELAAILDGRFTYDVQPLGLPRKPYLMYRHSFRIARSTREWKVVATHKCPPGPHRPTIRQPPTTLVIPYASASPDIPPF
ncbi:hypothetical protein ACFXJ8_11975 [Nonomuraea sp. NPDC059194]|uniref:hypothetical protein n=1 Tax=Nonomuraea sp. NPDC059194 TaxID=3346764 RepID=UPI00369D8CCC